jgi:hypothetical protein
MVSGNDSKLSTQTANSNQEVGGKNNNQRGGGRSGNSQPSTPTTKGLVPALSGYIFDYGPGKTREQLRVNWEKLIQYVGITYVQDIKIELTTRKRVEIPLPQYPKKALEEHNLAEEERTNSIQDTISAYTNALDLSIKRADTPGLIIIELEALSKNEIDLHKELNILKSDLRKKTPIVLYGDEALVYEASKKHYHTDTANLKKDRGQVYSLIISQCSSRLKDRLEKEANWDTIQSNQDPLELFALSEKLTLSHTIDTYPYAAWYEALIALCMTRLENNEADFIKKFDTLLRVFKAQGGQIYLPAQLDYETLMRPQAKKDGITFYEDLPSDEQEAIRDTVEEKAATYMMLRQSGAKHANLRMDIQNYYAKGAITAYPSNRIELQRMFETLSFSKPAGSNQSHGTAFAQQQTKGTKKKDKKTANEEKDSSSTTTSERKPFTRPDAHLPPYNRAQWTDLACTHCGIKGHPFTHCYKLLKANLAVATGVTPQTVPPAPPQSSASSLTTNTGLFDQDVPKELDIPSQLSFLQTVHTTLGQHSLYQGDLALRDVILLESQSTMDLFCNKDYVTSTYATPDSCNLQSNGGTMLISQKATVAGLHQDVWYDPNAITNIIALHNLSKHSALPMIVMRTLALLCTDKR